MQSFSRPVAEAKSVSELVELARHGKLRIPPFQRRFRWDGTDVERLFDSIRRGYPIGSLLLWERAAPTAEVRFGPFRVDADADDDALWVVDGQQRLTSLVGVLAGPPDAGAEFDLYYDLAASEFRRPRSGQRPSDNWVPLRRIIDTNAFVRWLLEFKEHGATEDDVNGATELGNQIRDYKVPVALVRNAQEQELRDIFDRMNTFGKRLTQAEVFQSLYTAADGTKPSDLRALVHTVRDLGFGSVREETVLRAVLAARGGNPYRDFRGEFDEEDPADAFRATADALEHTVDFLQRDAGIPHLRALPYVYVIPVLTRFFSLHADASERSRILLRRWLWRDATVGGSGRAGAAAVLQRAVQAIDENEDESVQRLLGLVSGEPSAQPDLHAHQLNRAAGRVNLALLAQLNPLDLETGKSIDVPALLDEGEPLRLLSADGRVESIANLFLHPPPRDDEFVELLVGASDNVLASHGLSRETVAAVEVEHGGDADVVRRRARMLFPILRDRLAALTEWGAADRPALAALVVRD